MVAGYSKGVFADCRFQCAVYILRVYLYFRIFDSFCVMVVHLLALAWLATNYCRDEQLIIVIIGSNRSYSNNTRHALHSLFISKKKHIVCMFLPRQVIRRGEAERKKKHTIKRCKNIHELHWKCNTEAVFFTPSFFLFIYVVKKRLGILFRFHNATSYLMMPLLSLVHFLVPFFHFSAGSCTHAYLWDVEKWKPTWI